jgi:hypothetical protein
VTFNHIGPELVSAVDEAFRNLMDAIFGADVMEDYRKMRPAGYVDLVSTYSRMGYFFL